jgi:hypothetical protein
MVNMRGRPEVERPDLSPLPPLFLHKQLYRLKRNDFVSCTIEVKLRTIRLVF